MWINIISHKIKRNPKITTFFEIKLLFCLRAMDFLIKNGADLNAVGSTKVDRCTALHVAAMNGHYDAIEMLLKHGADPTKLDDKCCSPSQERFYFTNDIVYVT